MLTFLRSRMFTPAFKLFSGFAVVGLTGAFVLALSTNDNAWTFDGEFPFLHIEEFVASFVGPITLGWKGTVGNHYGYVVLASMGAVSAFLAGMLIIFRDADPEAQAEAGDLETVPLTRPPVGRSYWPVFLGLVIMGIWSFQNWAYRATGDDAVNREIYHRFIDPMRIPVVAFVGIGLVVIGFSRVLLAAPSAMTAVVIFAIVGSALFGVLVVMAYTRSSVSNTVWSVLLVIGALLFLAAGIAAAVIGEREFHHGGHGAEHGAFQVVDHPVVLDAEPIQEGRTGE